MKKKFIIYSFFTLLTSQNLIADNSIKNKNITLWLNSKEFRFAEYMSKCKIQHPDSSISNCNEFNNLRHRHLEDKFKLGNAYQIFE